VVGAEILGRVAVDWTKLSPQAAWTVVNVAWPMSAGFSIAEVAGQVGREDWPGDEAA
jgi:hypothetical protein